MKKIIFALCAVALSAAAARAQTTVGQDGDGRTVTGQADYAEAIRTMCGEAAEARAESDYAKAEASIRQALMVFESQGRGFQEENAELKGELYYGMARYLALQEMKDEALDALALAIDHGWADYRRAKSDGDLDNIRRTKRFRQMMRTIKGGKSS